MTHTAHNTVGFEKSYNKSFTPTNPLLYEGATGTTYTKGTLLGIQPAGQASAGLLASLNGESTVDENTLIVGVAAETKTTTDSDHDLKVWPINNEVFTVSFDGHWDVSGNKTSTADNRFHPNAETDSTGGAGAEAVGALLYMYEGPCKGDVRTITGHTTGAAGTSLFTVSGEFSATPTTASKAVILVEKSSDDIKAGANVGSQLKLSTASASKVSIKKATFADGYINVLSVDPANLKMDVMIAPAKSALQYGRTAT